MTNGQFLAIGQLACSGCKAKSLKGLDFSNSRTIVPDTNSPSLAGGDLGDLADLAGPIKKEAEEEMDVKPEETPLQRQMLIREISVHRDVVLPASTSAQGETSELTRSLELIFAKSQNDQSWFSHSTPTTTTTHHPPPTLTFLSSFSAPRGQI